MNPANITELLATYIHSLHILHYHGVVDAYGHLSVRNPDDPSTFFMMHQMGPALVSGPNDIGEYRVSDAEPVNPDTPAAPLERYIHSETLKRYSDVNVVLHGHASELVSYSISEVPLRAAIHMAPFLGESVPNFDITKYYQPTDTQDFLVRNQRLGAALAETFDENDGKDDNDNDGGDDGNGTNGTSTYPGHNLVLMRSHGFSAVATDIKIVTYEGVYALTNAQVQSGALKIQHAYGGEAAQAGDGIVYLDARQVQDSWQTESAIVDKPWASWVREVKVNPLYVNELDPGQ